MIDSVTGLPSYVTSDSVVLNLHSGLAVSVLVPDPAPFNHKPGSDVTLYTQLAISGVMNGDGELKLYGFLTRRDRDVFLLLKSVSGVGGSAALKILCKGADNVIDAILHNEPDALRVKGVGPKITKRIVDDLQKKAASLYRERV